MNGKIISGPAAILILLLFFLPWVSVSCGDVPVGDFNGFQLASMEDDDKTLQEDSFFNRPAGDKTAPFPGSGSTHKTQKTEALSADPNLKGWLVIDSGSRKGDRFKLLADTIIGRDPNNDIYIDDTAMSANHVRVVLSNGRFTVYDQHSTNGLYTFDPQRNKWGRQEQVLLQDGTRIKLGRTVLVFIALNPDT